MGLRERNSELVEKHLSLGKEIYEMQFIDL